MDIITDIMDIEGIKGINDNITIIITITANIIIINIIRVMNF